MSQIQKLIRKLRPRSPAGVTQGQGHGVGYRKLYDTGDRLYTAIQRHDMDQLVEVLSEPNRDVNQVPLSTNKPPVIVASEEGNLAALQMLVDRGADVNDRVRREEHGPTPLVVAATLGHVDIVRYLLDNGADINTRSNHSALGIVRSDSVGILPEGERREIMDAYHMNTALIQACREGHLDVVEELLVRGCDVNIQNDNGNTALHVACLGRTFYPYSTSTSQFVPATFFLQPNIKIVEALLKHGARTDILNHDRNTAIQRVFQVRCNSALQMLGWEFTLEENNSILVRIFSVMRLLLQYGCNLPRGFWMHLKHYHDRELSKEIMVTVKFAENFGLLPETFPVIKEALDFSLDNGCKYDPEDIRCLQEYDPGFKDLVDCVLPLVSCPRPLKSQCRTFLRSLLGSLHGGLQSHIVLSLQVPSALAHFILGEQCIPS